MCPSATKTCAAKKNQAAKRKQKQVHVKEIKFRPGTDEGDYQIKLRKLTEFLEAGDKTKVTLRFRGREMAHKELGAQLLARVRDDLEEYGSVEQMPQMEGRQMVGNGRKALSQKLVPKRVTILRDH